MFLENDELTFPVKLRSDEKERERWGERNIMKCRGKRRERDMIKEEREKDRESKSNRAFETKKVESQL